MAARSLEARLFDIIEAIEHIQSETTGATLDSFEADWRKQWFVERGVEIASETTHRPLSVKGQARSPLKMMGCKVQPSYVVAYYPELRLLQLHSMGGRGS